MTHLITLGFIVLGIVDIIVCLFIIPYYIGSIVSLDDHMESRAHIWSYGMFILMIIFFIISVYIRIYVFIETAL